MSFITALFSDFILVVRVIGIGFLLRLGCFGFDSLLSLLDHRKKNHPSP